MLKVLGRADSSNVQALMWAIAELGLTSERQDVGHRFAGNDTPEFLSMNPNGTVPVLLDGDDRALWETSAILRYLSSRYAPDSFWPRDEWQRADVDRWAEWSKINIALNFTAPVFWRVVRTPAENREPERIKQAVKKLEFFLAIAENRLQSKEFLCGEALTLADIQFGHCLFRYFDIDIKRSEFTNIRRYFDRLMERRAYRENVAVTYEALRE